MIYCGAEIADGTPWLLIIWPFGDGRIAVVDLGFNGGFWFILLRFGLRYGTYGSTPLFVLFMFGDGVDIFISLDSHRIWGSSFGNFCSLMFVCRT